MRIYRCDILGPYILNVKHLISTGETSGEYVQMLHMRYMNRYYLGKCICVKIYTRTACCETNSF